MSTGSIHVIGHIWWPSDAVCAYDYSLSTYDLENLNNESERQGISRNDIQSWLDKNAGDFSEILDFAAEIREAVYGWKSEESEMTYFDCLYEQEA